MKVNIVRCTIENFFAFLGFHILPPSQRCPTTPYGLSSPVETWADVGVADVAKRVFVLHTQGHCYIDQGNHVHEGSARKMFVLSRVGILPVGSTIIPRLIIKTPNQRRYIEELCFLKRFFQPGQVITEHVKSLRHSLPVIKL